MKRYLPLILLIGITLVAFFLRFYKLGEIPNGLYRDETSIGYNAYSILKTGRDEYGKFMPLYFKSFGDWKLPIYIYSSVFSVKLFGLTSFAVRLPSAFFGFLTVFISYFFIKDIAQNKKLALVTSLLLAVNPWMLFYNRATFEVSICLFFFVLGSWLIFLGLKKGKSLGFLLGTIAFIIVLYGYNLTRLLSPLLYLFLILIYRKSNKVDKSEIYATGILSLILLLPFISTLFSNGGASSASGTLIFSSSVIKAQLLEFKSYINILPALLIKTVFNLNALLVWNYFQNIVSYLSVTFYFVTGDPHGNHGLGDMGYFYLFELPFIIYGIYTCMKQKENWQIFLISWSTMTILVASLTRYDVLPFIPQATRSFFLVFPFEVFSAIGIISFWNFLKDKSQGVRFIVLGMAGIIMLFNFIYYFSDYYIRFPVAYAKNWQAEDKKISDYLNSQKTDKIIIDPSVNLSYTSIVFYQKYSPSLFQKQAVRTPDDSEGFTTVLSFGKYEFRQIDWANDMKIPNELLVTISDKIPSGASTITRFDYPTRPVVVSDKQNLLSYPTTDNAYVVVETK